MFRPYFQLPAPIYILCIGTFVNRAGTFVLVFMSLYLNKRLNLGIEFATMAMGAAGFGSLMAGLIGGHLADHIGRRTVMIASMLGSACIAVALSQTLTPWKILVLFVAFTLITDMYRPAVSAMIADLVPPEQRPQAYALMYVSINLGFAAAPVIGGRLAEHSFAWLFWADAATSTVYAMILLAKIRETLPLKTGLILPGTSTISADHVPFRQAARQILNDRVYLWFVFGMWLVALTFIQAHSTLPIYMSTRGFTEKQYGDVVAINGMLIVLAQLPITAVSTRFPRGAMLMAAAILTGGGFALTGLARVQWHFGLVTVVWTIGEMIQAPLMSAIVGDLAPATMRARYMGVLSMSFSAAVAIGSPLGGWVLANHGGAPLWGACLVLGCIAAGMFAMIYRKVGPRGAVTT